MRILSWNVNGIRALARKGFTDWLKKDAPDILCLQETKACEEQLDRTLLKPKGYHTFWNCAERKGYSGVATFCRAKPLSVRKGVGIERFDLEGRVLITEHPDFFILNIYFPNGKMNKERLRYKLDFYDAFLDFAENLREQKPLLVCGDYNTAHREIDLSRPKENSKVSGFLPVERTWMDALVASGFVDTFRHVHGDRVEYSWWDLKTRARERNVGWRIDYFFATEDLIPRIEDAFILKDVMGSDHAPVGVIVK
jgi:exodeoxyribonuclease-3